MQAINIALALFRSGLVSAGFAARVAGKPLDEMLSLLSSQGIPLTGEDQTADEIREEMRQARNWLTKTE